MKKVAVTRVDKNEFFSDEKELIILIDAFVTFGDGADRDMVGSCTMNTLSRALQSLRRLPKEILKFPEELLGLSVAEKGEFYAAALTSSLNSRYTLIGKLGWGIHSSVWLARDMR